MRDNSIIYKDMETRNYTGVMVFLLLLLNVLWCNGCWEQEKIALLQLKQFFDNPHNPLNWNEGGGQSTSNCCEWERVMCNSTTGRVIELYPFHARGWDLPTLYLNASYFIPFEELRILDLRNNRIGGCLEEEGFEILSLKLRNLEVLDLGENQFDDSIVASLASISSLKSIYLDRNGMEASSNYNGFERLSELRCLELLDLSSNRFNNNLISSLGSLSSLKVLNLSDNLLSGTIDIQELNNLSNLKELNMGANKINGFTSSKGAEPLLRSFNLEVLDLYDNLFNNNVFSSLTELSRLKSLNLEGNLLTGSIHVKELEALMNLEELNMGYTNIDEFVGPEDKRTLNNLEVLRLCCYSNKSLELKLLGAFSSLKILDLQDNILNGTMNLLELANLSTVKELYLDYSILHKNFLQSIGSLTSLRVLRLHDCMLEGPLPGQGWCELENLQELDLSGNELEGTLPPCLSNLSSLQNLDLSNNQFRGNLAYTSIPGLVSIEYLFLEYNHFQIPISFRPFANSSNLNGFYGNNNKLTRDLYHYSWTPKFQLQTLSLAHCTLNQSIAKVPYFLYYQYNLSYVDLSSSSFGGVLPLWLLENNTRLEIFSSKNNSFSGQFQLPLHPNPILSSLDIANNKLQGQIPSNISVVFPYLNMLVASGNDFQGSIPHSLCEIKSLKILDLSSNHLSGQIPELFFEQLSFFDWLTLSNNNLAGEIPDLLSSKYLSVLDISNNSLSGRLPKSMGNLSNLEHIDLANNNLEGPIPSEFCQLYKLQNLILSDNNFSGTIPACLNQLQSLRDVYLNKNKLSGLMPSAFINSSNLIILDLRNNYFYGPIPNWIGSLSKLSVLMLQANHFRSKIPTALCQLNRLNILDLSSNSLSGHLPPCLGNLTTARGEFSQELYMRYLNESFGLVGTFDDLRYLFPTIREVVEFTSKRNSLHYTREILDDMYGIDLSCNNFSGEIPIEFGNLSNVRGLNLSHNTLTGAIPTTFSKLKQIESLDLSHNHLKGQIPYQLMELNFLAVFSVAYNNLSGPIPYRNAQFATFDENSYKGNPYLCGPPLNTSCDKTSPALPTLNFSHNNSKDDGFMDIDSFYVSFATSYVMVLLGIAIFVSISPYWRQAWFHIIEVINTTCYYFLLTCLR